MKKLLFVLILFLIAGCSNTGGDELVDYNHRELEAHLQEQAFQPQLPTKLPFEPEKVDFEPGALSQQDTLLEFDFYGESKEWLELKTFRTFDGNINLSDDVEEEEVEVMNQEATYYKNDHVKGLVWKRGDISYQLVNHTESSSLDIEKDVLIETADSFQ